MASRDVIDSEINPDFVHNLFSSLNNPDEYRDPNIIYKALSVIARISSVDQTYLARSATVHIFSVLMDSINPASLDRVFLEKRLRIIFDTVRDDYSPEIATGVRAGITGILADRLYLDTNERAEYGVAVMDDIDPNAVTVNIEAFKDKLANHPNAIKVVLLNGGLGFARIMDIHNYFSIPASATEELVTGAPKVDNNALESVRLRLEADSESEIFVMDDVVDTGSTLLASVLAILKLKLSVNLDTYKADALKIMLTRVSRSLASVRNEGSDISDPDFNLQHAAEMYELTKILAEPPFNIHVAVLTDKLMGKNSLAKVYGKDFSPSYDVIYPSFVDNIVGERVDPVDRPWLMGFSTLDTGVVVTVTDPNTGVSERFKVSVGRSLKTPLVLNKISQVSGKYTHLNGFKRMQVLVWNTLVDMGVDPQTIQFPGLELGQFPGSAVEEA